MKKKEKKNIDLTNRKLLAPYGTDLVTAAAQAAGGNRDAFEKAIKVGIKPGIKPIGKR